MKGKLLDKIQNGEIIYKFYWVSGATGVVS